MKLNLSLSLLLSLISVPLLSEITLASTQIRDLKSLQGIEISGEVTSIVGNDFMLDDGTGEVIVDAGPRWWHQIDLTTGESVTVIGEMDEGEFEAFSIARENGETIEIRPPQGPPPWSGDRQNKPQE
ncbi:MAG: hypothetical protein RLZZ381_2127 [Cyanobacteriota bacterium]|jgi:uncharacterized protein YdeI (BOF family)